MRGKLLFGGILLILSIAGCKGCSGQDRTLLSFVPSDTEGALVFPDIAATAKDLALLLDKFSVGPLATFINQGHIEINRLVGFDPLKVEDIRKLGLAPSKGIAIVPVDDQPVLIAGLSDKKTVQNELQKRMKEIAAAQDHSTKTISGVTINVISAKVGQVSSPAIIFAFCEDYVLIGGAKTTPDALVKLIKLTQEQSLDKAKWYKTITARAGKQPDMLLVINASKAKKLSTGLSDASEWIDQGVAWSVSVQPSSLESRIFVGLSSQTAQKLKGFTDGIKDAHLERYLPDDTVIALKLRADTGKLLDEAFGLDPNFKHEFQNAVQSAKQATGGDLEKDSIRNLTGNLAIGLSLGNSDQINKLLRTLSQGQAEAPETPQDFEQALQFFYWAQVKDASTWVQVVENLLSMTGKKSGIKVDKTMKDGMTVYRLASSKAQGGAIFLLQKDDVVGGCFGKNCIQRAKNLLAGKTKSLPGSLSRGTKRLFEQASLAVAYLNWAQVLNVIDGLDASCMGDGGMATKMVLDLAMTAVKNLKELTGLVLFSKGGMEISGRLELQ